MSEGAIDVGFWLLRMIFFRGDTFFLSLREVCLKVDFRKGKYFRERLDGRGVDASPREFHVKESIDVAREMPPTAALSYHQLALTLLRVPDPFAHFVPPPDIAPSDWYPHSALEKQPTLAQVLAKEVDGYMLELGSFIGNSAAAWERALRAVGKPRALSAWTLGSATCIGAGPGSRRGSWASRGCTSSL